MALTTFTDATTMVASEINNNFKDEETFADAARTGHKPLFTVANSVVNLSTSNGTMHFMVTVPSVLSGVRLTTYDAGGNHPGLFLFVVGGEERACGGYPTLLSFSISSSGSLRTVSEILDECTIPGGDTADANSFVFMPGFLYSVSMSSSSTLDLASFEMTFSSPRGRS